MFSYSLMVCVCVQSVCSQPAAGEDHPHHQRSDQHHLQRDAQPLCSGSASFNVSFTHMNKQDQNLLYIQTVSDYFIPLAGLADERPGQGVCRQRLRDLQHAAGAAEITKQARGGEEGEIKRD